MVENVVTKYVLENGLVVLVYPIHTIPKVAVQLWYGVGSKDEKDGQRGLAHLLEHMVFKGTKVLSESDINLITHKLSGSCNAFTSHDYTGYVFDLPKQNWHFCLDILADCMRNCTFKSDLLNSELKAVIQELKMYNDEYRGALCQEMVTAIFDQHPYHYPIIGYKQDLWNITQKGLLDFYHHHYIPNNATLIVVGDVDREDVFQKAKKAFGNITADPTYVKESYHHQKDLRCQSITMRRDIQHPIVMYAWQVPGLRSEQHYTIDCASWILAQGKGSRLYKKLVEEQELAADVQIDLYEFFDSSLLFLHVDPIEIGAIEDIGIAIKQEITALAQHGFEKAEFERAVKQASMEYWDLFNSNQKIADEIGKYYLAAGNENGPFENHLLQTVSAESVGAFFKKYITPTSMNAGLVLPLAADEKNFWLTLQEEADRNDAVILSRKVRETVVEPGVLVDTINPLPQTAFAYPKAHKKVIANGLTLLWHNTNLVPKIELILDFEMRSYYDPEDKQGLINFMTRMLLQGTLNFPDQSFAMAAEARGISIEIRPGSIVMSFLKQELEYALFLLLDLLVSAEFKEKNVAKVRTHIKNDIVEFWDAPSEFCNQIIKSILYKGHPYHKDMLGDLKSIQKITRADLFDAYKKYITPAQARLALVGDLDGIDIVAVVERILGSWQGQELPDLVFPSLEPIHAHEVDYPINRDQTVLCFTGHSVKRTDERYDALVLFDQIFSGGLLGSMSSYLFALREQSGLFYTISASLVVAAEDQPGIAYIKTIVSNDRLYEAEQLIEQAIMQAPDIITEENVEQARNAVISSLVDNFESNETTAGTFIFLERFNLPSNYFEQRLKHLKIISPTNIKEAVKDILSIDKLLKVRIGRKR